MARAQALEMVKGNFVGHKSASGHSFSARFEAFADPDQRGDFGENAARDRQSVRGGQGERHAGCSCSGWTLPGTSAT
jgi:uncharacterized protein YkwD